MISFADVTKVYPGGTTAVGGTSNGSAPQRRQSLAVRSNCQVGAT